MKSAVVALSFLLLISCGQDTSSSSPVAETKSVETTFKILALGDSLTEGLGVNKASAYPAQLEAQLKKIGFEYIEVINAGLSGETSSGLKNRLNWVLKQKPDLTILCIGANDAMRGLPLDLTRNNIIEIIQSIKNSDSDLILAGMEIYDNLGKEYVKGFRDIYPQIAKQHNLPFIRFFLNGVAGDSQLNQADMIHPNAKGYQVIIQQNILPVVLEYLEQHKLRESNVNK